MKKEKLSQSAIEIVKIIKDREPLTEGNIKKVAVLIELLAVRHASQECLELTNKLQDEYYGLRQVK